MISSRIKLKNTLKELALLEKKFISIQDQFVEILRKHPK